MIRKMRGKVDSNPIMPFAAYSNSRSFSTVAVRRMIRSYYIDGPIGKSGLDRFDVLGVPERWIDLVDRVEGRDQFIGESKIMWRGLRADGQSPVF